MVVEVLSDSTEAYDRGAKFAHYRGVPSLLAYVDARFAIYLPAYRFVLEHRVAKEVEQRRALGERSAVVLLDYETNARVEDPSRPLSHAALVIAWLMGAWPSKEAPSRKPT